ncbi:hypothetical protein F2P81_008821 [Scophthalmus maximus]|uniref:Uncharacterized protein n=1 Tax=Scophthalmus maximus TaxID=52904 RepID=A0A6A4SXM1_SCOMX|nr:hypothetical protein F2P81_008821 [Scophthalmus maximus]
MEYEQRAGLEYRLKVWGCGSLSSAVCLHQGLQSITNSHRKWMERCIVIDNTAGRKPVSVPETIQELALHLMAELWEGSGGRVLLEPPERRSCRKHHLLGETEDERRGEEPPLSTPTCRSVCPATCLHIRVSQCQSACLSVCMSCLSPDCVVYGVYGAGKTMGEYVTPTSTSDTGKVEPNEAQCLT